MSDESKLTERQKRFADEYLIDLNATAAYKRAGYAATGHSAESAAARLLSNVEVAEYISARQVKLQEKLEITQERITAEYAKLAFLDPRRFYDEQGKLIPVHKLDADVAAALAGMEITVSRSGTDAEGKPEYEDVKKIKFIDKKGALDSLSRTLGMFNDKLEHSGQIDMKSVSDDDLDRRIAEASRKVGIAGAA